jgi:predicted AlkP superfamily pyrophosphatase or phosphodiesterase
MEAEPMRGPDYQGGSIVNLMSSIMAARGGQPAAPALREVPTQGWAEVTNLALLVIDGLGADWLARQSPNGILNQHRVGTLTSVFPSTTAAAIPTYLTGAAPVRHGLTGWHTFLGELGCVMTVLPGVPRCGGVPYRQAGIDPARLFAGVPIADRIDTRSLQVVPTKIAGSDFNRALSGRAEIHPFGSLKDLFRRTSSLLRGWGRRRTERKYLYLYWPQLDAIGHKHGMEGPEARRHLAEIEAALTGFLQEIAGTDTLLLVCADHGQIDSSAADTIDLGDHPELTDCLLLPLCGEPRAAFAYVRASRLERFVAYVSDVLSDRVDLIPSERLLAEHLFGLETPHPRFAERVGDLCLLPKGRVSIRHWLPFEQRYQQVGVHGGLTDAELLVPLCQLRAPIR